MTLSDVDGLLSATGTGVSGSGTTSLTITGSLAQVNSDLATLSDTDSTVAPDTITLNATDSFGNTAGVKTIAVTVNGSAGDHGAGVAQTIGVGKSAAIGGVSVSESGNTSGETFTVTLSDVHGLLSASGTGVSGSGTTSLTITGSLSQVNSDLATLADIDGTTPSDTITLNATDSFGNSAAQQQVSVTVNALPVISAPTTATVSLSQSTAISGISVSEIGNVTSETFTVTLADTNGLLSATGAGVSGSGTTSLTITGSINQVNADLATLTDTDGTTPSDTINVNATDSFGNVATQKQVAVTVTAQLVPAITAPSSTVVGVGQSTAIAGVSLSETGNTPGETFTVTLVDTHGLLSATGAGVSGSGTNSLTVTGSLAQVNTDLATLHDTDATLTSDTITLNASDSFGNIATQETDRGHGERAARHRGAGGKDRRRRQVGGDCRRQPLGDGSHRRRDLHRDAHRHQRPALGDRHGDHRLGHEQPDHHRLAHPGEHRSRHAARHGRHGGLGHDQSQRHRQLRQRCSPAAGRRYGERASRHRGAGRADRRRRPVGGDRRRQPIGDGQHDGRELHGDARRHKRSALGDRHRRLAARARRA